MANELENRIADQEHLMATHVHKGNVSYKLDTLSETDVDALILANEDIYASITASDEVRLEDATEITNVSEGVKLIYTISNAYPGTIRVKADGKESVTGDAFIVVLIKNPEGTQTDSESFPLTTDYVSYSDDFTVGIAYTVEIQLNTSGGATGYMKNVEICYDITKDQGVTFL